MFLLKKLIPLIVVTINLIHVSATKKKAVVVAKSNLKETITAQDVKIKIPLPSDAMDVDFDKGVYQNNDGKVSFSEGDQCFYWEFKEFEGQTEKELLFGYWVPTVRDKQGQAYKGKPIEVNFEIIYYTVSGIQVRYLKIVDESGYDATPWVRYITSNGEYFIRQ